MGKMKRLSTGFLIGTIASGVAVLLTTPKSGRAVRDNIKTKSEQAKTSTNEMKKNSLHFKDQIVKTVKEGIPAVKEASKDIQYSLQRWKEGTSGNKKRMKENIEAIQKTTQELNQRANKK